MRLDTERLVLRPLSVDDIDDLAELHRDPRVTAFIGQFGNLDPGARVEQAVVDWRTRGYGLMAVTDRASGRFLGRCGLQSVTGHAEPELGWVLRADAWGRGYGSEAARACLAWALADLRLTSVISLIHPRNHAAVRVAERVGMVHDGAAELRGVPVDVYRANSVTAASQ